MEPVISVVARRGDVVEARHRVHAVAVRAGEAVAAAGDPGLVCYLRSAAKPFQALPLLRACPGLPDEEAAIACASHGASDEQLAAVRALLARAGASEADLECGPEGSPPSPLRHNCSGKHAGFLLLCRLRGWSVRGYRLPGHPLQQAMAAEVAAAAGIAAGELAQAVDGCGVLTFALPLRRAALAWGRLPGLEAGGRAAAAMRARPELVGGPRSEDTRLMRALPGWTAKYGAEGLLCAVGPDGTAVALKSEDGSRRPLPAAAAAFLARLGVDVPALARDTVANSRGEDVGEVVTET